MPRDEYVVYATEDCGCATFCKSDQAVREEIEKYACTAGLHVRRITIGEISRDVTSDFIADGDAPEYPDWEREASRGDRLYRERMEGVRP